MGATILYIYSYIDIAIDIYLYIYISIALWFLGLKGAITASGTILTVELKTVLPALNV